MALFIVLHHRRDPAQPWANAWHDDDRIEAIQTTPDIAKAALAAGRVFVHRCAWGSAPAAVVCEARVLRISSLDRRSSLVRFEALRVLSAAPPATVIRGQNSYLADAPD